MKTIKKIVFGIILIGTPLCSTVVMSSCTDLYEEHQPQSTGDNADDGVKPGESSSNSTTADPYATGDNADDPVGPGGN